MRRTDTLPFVFLVAAALAAPAHALMKGPAPARPGKMQPTASTPAAAPTTRPLTPQGPLAAQPATGTVKPLTPQGPLAAPGVAPKPTAGTSPNVANRKARSGGDDELDELEVERRKAQNTPQVGGAPQPRPGAGTSPNTGRSSRSGADAGWK